MTDISCYILKPFPYSLNGVEEEHAEAGKTLPIPERLFSGLNKEGYVRRADIGDGHFSLNLDPEPSRTVEVGVTEIVEVSVASGEGTDSAPVSVIASSPQGRVDDIIRTVVNAAKNITGVAKPAPQPASTTAELTEEESAALADGSWKDWRFFKQRSVAAKLSDKPIKDGADANAAIEAHIAAQKA